MKKVLKIFIVWLLIVAMIFPTNAAIAGDGSAFVTKAEFDSALADYNSRLTVFESTVNSRIDSQVTTYLDRNGIWAGKKQDLVSTNASWQYGFNNQGTFTSPYGYCQDYGNRWRLQSWTLGKIGIYDNKSGNLVNNVNKSGLAIVSTSCLDSDYYENDVRCYVVSSRPAMTDFQSDEFQFVWNAKIEFIQDSKVINVVDYSLSFGQAGIYLVVPKIPANVLVMFVNRDKPLEIKYSNTLNRDTGTDGANTIGWVGGASGGITYRKWKVDSVTVY